MKNVLVEESVITLSELVLAIPDIVAVTVSDYSGEEEIAVIDIRRELSQIILCKIIACHSIIII